MYMKYKVYAVIAIRESEHVAKFCSVYIVFMEIIGDFTFDPVWGSFGVTGSKSSKALKQYFPPSCQQM